VRGGNSERCAYAILKSGRLPERYIAGDYIVVPTYDIGASADWPLKDTDNPETTNEAFSGYIEALQNKLWYDQWSALLGAGTGNLMSHGGLPNGEKIGYWDIRQLIEFHQLRNNSRFTDVAVGGHIFERAFGEGINEATVGICKVHKVAELGMMKPLWQLYQDQLAGDQRGLIASTQLALFVDNRFSDSFVTVVRDDLTTWVDHTMPKQERNGIYGWLETGVAILNGSNVSLGVFYEK